MKNEQTFFMADNRIFEYDLKLRDIAVHCFLCHCLNRENNVAFPQERISPKGAVLGKRKLWARH